MNLNFDNQLTGGRFRGVRSSISSLLSNIAQDSSVPEDGWSAKVCRADKASTDLGDNDDGVQLKGYNRSDATIIILYKGRKYSASMQFANGGCDKVVTYFTERNSAPLGQSLPMIEDKNLFMKRPKPAVKKVLPKIPPTPAPKPTTKKPTPEKAVANFTLDQHGLGIALLAISDACGDGGSFTREEALEWLVDAKIGMTLNRHAGRAVSALLRCGVINQFGESGQLSLTPIGTGVVSGNQEFPEVPKEKRKSRKKRLAPGEDESPSKEEGEEEDFNPDGSEDVEVGEEPTSISIDTFDLPEDAGIFTGVEEVGEQVREFIRTCHQLSTLHNRATELRSYLSEVLPENVIETIQEIGFKTYHA